MLLYLAVKDYPADFQWGNVWKTQQKRLLCLCTNTRLLGRRI